MADQWEHNFKLSLGVGVATIPEKQISIEEKRNEKKVTVGGAGFTYGVGNALSPSIMGGVYGGALYDMVNQQILRTNGEVGLNYYLLGGVKNHQVGREGIVVNNLFSYGIYIPARVSLASYNSSSADGSVEIKGLLLEFRTGIGFRWGRAESLSSYGVELTYLAVDLPASSERLGMSMAELSFFLSL